MRSKIFDSLKPEDVATLEQLETCIVVSLVLVFAAAIAGYAALPQVHGTKKMSFWSFFFGTSCLQYVRRKGDPVMTVEDVPNTGGTSTYNIDGHAELLESLWKPADERSLFRGMFRHVVPWWIAAMLLGGASRALNFIQSYYGGTCVVIVMMADTLSYDYIVMEMMVLGFIVAVGSAAVNNWCQLILALRCTDKVHCGLSVMIMRKVHRLSCQGKLHTNPAEAQQLMQEAYNIAVAIWSTPLVNLFSDLGMGCYSLYCLYAQIGVLGISSCVLSIMALTSIGSLCDNKRIQLEQATFGNFLRRQGVLNLMLDNFRELRIYDWMDRAAKPLKEVRDQIWSNSMWSGLYGAFGGVFTNQIDGVITVTTCAVMVFVQGTAVNFKDTTIVRVFMGVGMGNFFAIRGCYWSWLDMTYKFGRVEHFLRLPEVNTQDAIEGPLKVEGGSFAWPKWQIPDQARKTPEDSDKDKQDGNGAEKSNGEIAMTDQVVLQGIDLKPEQGELVLVCGAIGAGKSSLLHALVGEMRCVEGKRWQPSSPVAYQPQVPYLLEGTIRDNVLFGIPDSECDATHLQEALAASQLSVDMSNSTNTLHAKGDLTDVGKRGTHLSGGQRARTALARTVYAVLQGATVALLDDPLASVDNEVVQAAWEGAVMESMKGATRIVVVNSQLLERLAPTADKIVVMASGRIVYYGTPAKVMQDPEILTNALTGKFQIAVYEAETAWTWLPAGVGGIKDHAAAFGNPKEGDLFTKEHLEIAEKTFSVPLDFKVLAEQGMIEEASEEVAQKLRRQQAMAPAPALAPAPPQLAEEEEVLAEGEDSAMVLADMLRDSEHLRDFLCTPIQLDPEDQGRPLAEVDCPLKLSPADWDQFRTKLRGIERQHRHSEPQGKRKLTAFQVVCHFLRRSSFIFFVTMGMNVLMSFKDAWVLAAINSWEYRTLGDTTDWGYLARLLGVFVCFAVLGTLCGTLDNVGTQKLVYHLMQDVDEILVTIGLPYFWQKKQLAETQLRRVVNTNLGFLSGLAKTPLAAIEAFFLICMTSWYAPALWLLMPISCVGYYRMSFVTDWKTLQVWPVRDQLMNGGYAKVVEQWDVVPSIRGLKRQKHFEKLAHREIYSVPYLNQLHFLSEVLLSFFYHTIGAIFNAVAILIVVRMRAQGVHAHMTYGFWMLAVGFSGKINGLVYLYMPFRELLKQYDQMQDLFCSDTLETTDGQAPPPGWGRKGHISFEGVTFRYVGYLPPALRDVSLVVNPAEKLGVVGKTGSGKSTLVCLLLRLGPLKGMPPSSGGRVLIDGVDVATLRLSDLRQQIAVVPQEPTLFAMTLKENVGEEFTDAEVLTALEWCGLDARKMTNTEDGKVTDALGAFLWSGGLSVGQQQLVMAARALVRRSTVMILDECTASLDRKSADQLLEVIRTHTSSKTVISIAHRLRFVVHSDRILVLAGGQIVACETPTKLLEDADGYYAANLRLEQQQDQAADVLAERDGGLP